MVGGWDAVEHLEPGRTARGVRDFRDLIAALEAPCKAASVGPEAKPVYHLVLRNHADDRVLTDAEWGEIAADMMDRTGIAPAGDPLGARWIAVRHADDHVHVVATLVRQDGKRVRPQNDFARLREGAHAAESRYELSVKTAPADRTSEPPPTRAETEQAARNGRKEVPRDTLRRAVRTAAAQSESLEEFVAKLGTQGVRVRLRESERNPGEVTGYSVALEDQVDKDGKPVYFGGGRLASDLTLPKLRARWNAPQLDESTPGDEAVAASRGQAEPGDAKTPGPQYGATGRRLHGPYRPSPEERRVVLMSAAAAAKQGAEHINRAVAGGDLAGAADAAWAASDFLTSAARVLEAQRPGPLTAAARRFERAARETYGRVPAPSGAGHSLRAGARALSAIRRTMDQETRQVLALMAQMYALLSSVERMREQQQRAAQAAAAREAAYELRREYQRIVVSGPAGPSAARQAWEDRRAADVAAAPAPTTPTTPAPSADQWPPPTPWERHRGPQPGR
nr:relaxase/mobilization nuclease domain-containing protein [Motilibacter aurantiacus]